jgi:hypothetical protein
MASTVTFTAKTAFGNQRVFMGTMTATDGTDEVVTGLKYINYGSATPRVVTGAETRSNFVVNSTTNGSVKLTTGISGGVYNIIVIGR